MLKCMVSNSTLDELSISRLCFFQAVASLKSEALNKDLRQASNPISHFQVFKMSSIHGWMMNVVFDMLQTGPKK